MTEYIDACRRGSIDLLNEVEHLRIAVRELQKIIERMISSDLEVQKVRSEWAAAKKKALNCPPPESWLKAHGYDSEEG